MKLHTYFIALFLIACCTACEKFDVSSDADTFFHAQTHGAELPVWVRGNTGSGKFIIYINGGPGATSIDVARADLFDWSTGLEEHFAMVYYDQRGCGNAQGPIDETTLTVDQFAKDLGVIVTILKSEYPNAQIYLMGHSFGSFIGVSYLLDHQGADHIAGWISVDGAYNFDYDLSWQYRRLFLINIANEEIGKGNMISHWTEALTWADDNPVILTRDQKNEWRQFVGWPGGIIIPLEETSISFGQYLGIGFASSYNPFPAYLSSNLEIVNNRLNQDAEGRNLITAVSALTIPTLMIWGRYDDLIAPEEGNAVFDNFGTPSPDKQFVLLPNSSHEPYISDPDRFQEEVIEFVNTY